MVKAASVHCPPRVGFLMAWHVRPLQSPVSSLYSSLFPIEPHRPLSDSSLRDPEIFVCFAGCSGRRRLPSRNFPPPRLSATGRSPGRAPVLADGDWEQEFSSARALLREIPWQSSSVAGGHGEARLLLLCCGRRRAAFLTWKRFPDPKAGAPFRCLTAGGLYLEEEWLSTTPFRFAALRPRGLFR